jgi:DNA-binding NtrC family response regulator
MKLSDRQPETSRNVPLRVLMIEDVEDDAKLILHALRRGGYQVYAERVDTTPTLREALRRAQWDLITCDWVMPRLHPVEALNAILEYGLDTPIIVVSGELAEEVSVSSLRNGAHDYINKHALTMLLPKVQRQLREARERTRQRAAQDGQRRRSTPG